MPSTKDTATFLLKVDLDYDVALDHFWEFVWSHGGDWTDVVEELHTELFNWEVEFESVIDTKDDDPRRVRCTFYLLFKDTFCHMRGNWSVYNRVKFVQFCDFLLSKGEQFEISQLSTEKEVIQTLFLFEKFDIVGSTMGDYTYPLTYNNNEQYPLSTDGCIF